ncbi:MAG TPA: hypothetical protein VGR57_05685 [Ktedonobacterales bacterium]|nr:hypothetical protein [Ktedonobacterales bacterium]
MLEERPADFGPPTYADLAQAIADERLTVTRLGPEYFVRLSELRRWQIERLRAALRRRHPERHPDREAS